MTTDNPKKTNNIETFSWENEIPIHNGLDIINLFQALHNGQYYELPFSINAHGKYFYTLLFMRSALQLKANILGTTLKPNKFITSQTMAKLAMDYLWFGNCYLEKVVSKTGKLLALNHSPAKYTRKDKDNIFKFLINENTALDDNKNIHTYAQGSIYHLLQYDVNQEIYGVPEWLPAVQSSQLNEEATKFRLRYYRNGSHAGYIMYMTDPNINDTDIELGKHLL